MAPKETSTGDDDDWSEVDEDDGVMVGIEDTDGPPPPDEATGVGLGDDEAAAGAADEEAAAGDDAAASGGGALESIAGLDVQDTEGGDDDGNSDAPVANEATAEDPGEVPESAPAPDKTDHPPPPRAPLPPADDTLPLPEAKFYEGDKAMLVVPTDGDGEEAAGAPSEPVKVRIARVEPPLYTVTLPDGTETTVPFSSSVDCDGPNGGGGSRLYALDEYESLKSQKEKAETLGVVTTNWYGGDGGGPFNDMPDTNAVDRYRTRRIVEIAVRCGAIVDAIRVAYSDSSATFHGGEGGGEHAFALGGGEYITEVVVRYGKFVQRLTFTTNLGRKLGPCGGRGALLLGLTAREVVVKAPDRYMLAAVHGRCGKFVDGIGFHWVPVTAEAEVATKTELETRLKKQILLRSSDCYGGGGGGGGGLGIGGILGGGVEFDDGHYNIRITGLAVRTGSNNLVKGIGVNYYTGKVGSYGGTNLPGSKGKISSLTLEKGEYITEVTVGYGEQSVQSLTFVTDQGRQLGPCGKVDGGMEDDVKVAAVKAPEGYMLVGIKGRSTVALLESIGFNWSPAPKAEV